MFFHDRSIFLTKDFYFGRHFWEVSVINQLVLPKASDSIMKKKHCRRLSTSVALSGITPDKFIQNDYVLSEFVTNLNCKKEKRIPFASRKWTTVILSYWWLDLIYEIVIFYYAMQILNVLFSSQNFPHEQKKKQVEYWFLLPMI